MAALIARIIDGTISNKMARDVFAAMWSGENSGDPDAIIEARGLKQISDSGAIGAMIDEVLAANRPSSRNSMPANKKHSIRWSARS